MHRAKGLTAKAVLVAAAEDETNMQGRTPLQTFTQHQWAKEARQAAWSFTPAPWPECPEILR